MFSPLRIFGCVFAFFGCALLIAIGFAVLASREYRPSIVVMNRSDSTVLFDFDGQGPLTLKIPAPPMTETTVATSYRMPSTGVFRLWSADGKRIVAKYVVNPEFLKKRFTPEHVTLEYPKEE